MVGSAMTVAFGPVPSRRLGQSLGINNVPRKTCDYSCVYCQVGPTARRTTLRRSFFAPEQVASAVAGRMRRLKGEIDRIDYLTFVPDGEPTLDVNIGNAIARLKSLETAIAVITNSSLLWRQDVRDELSSADYVSVKVDTVDADAWRRINRPARSLEFSKVLDGVRAFAEIFRGTLTTETMLVEGINEDAAHVEETARFIAGLKPAKAYLALPTRPPAVPDCRPPTSAAFASALNDFSAVVPQTESLAEPDEGSFGFAGDAAHDLLATTAVHPMTEEDVDAFLEKAGADKSLLADLIASRRLVRIVYGGRTFYRAAE